jgi:hypothetical protein
MSTTRGIRTTVGVALAASAFLLAGCSSSGSVSSGKDALGGGDKSTSAPAGDKSSSSSSDSSSSSSSSSSSDSSGDSLGGAFNDPGCKAAMDAASNAMNNLNPSDPSSAKKMLTDIAAKMHDAAGKSKKPDAASAINKVGDDYAKIAGQLGGSSVPDMSALRTDAEAMGTACAS